MSPIFPTPHPGSVGKFNLYYSNDVKDDPKGLLGTDMVQSDTYDGTQFLFTPFGATLPAQQVTTLCGIYYAAWVVTPAGYTSGSDLGSFTFDQIKNGYKNGFDEFGDPISDVTKNYDNVLDWGFHYKWCEFTDEQGGYAALPVPAGPGPEETGSNHWLLFEDRPTFDFPPSNTDLNYSVDFGNYIMYLPPGPGASWVPICQLTWNADGEAWFVSSDASGYTWDSEDFGTGFGDRMGNYKNAIQFPGTFPTWTGSN